MCLRCVCCVLGEERRRRLQGRSLYSRTGVVMEVKCQSMASEVGARNHEVQFVY
jgi:hypothetical protein